MAAGRRRRAPRGTAKRWLIVGSGTLTTSGQHPPSSPPHAPPRPFEEGPPTPSQCAGSATSGGPRTRSAFPPPQLWSSLSSVESAVITKRRSKLPHPLAAAPDTNTQRRFGAQTPPHALAGTPATAVIPRPPTMRVPLPGWPLFTQRTAQLQRRGKGSPPLATALLTVRGA